VCPDQVHQVRRQAVIGFEGIARNAAPTETGDFCAAFGLPGFL
jgi:hypothetical protein